MNRRRRSLRVNVLVFSGIMLAVFIVMLVGITQFFMQQQMIDQESIHIHEQLDTVKALFYNANIVAQTLAKDFAVWEETDSFAKGDNPDFLQKNWTDASPVNHYQYHFMFIKDYDGNDKYAGESNAAQYLPAYDAARLSAHITPLAQEVLAQYAAGEKTYPEIPHKAGVVFFEDVPYYLCTVPIVGSLGQNVPGGTLTVGYILTDPYFDALAHIDAEFTAEKPPDGFRADYVETSQDVGISSITLSAALQDNDGGLIMLRITKDRWAFGQGRRMINFITLLLLVSVALFIMALYYMLTHYLMKPIEALKADIGQMNGAQDLKLEKYSDSTEFYVLGETINEMRRHQREASISVEVFKRIFSGMDAHLYVSDIETNEILFINQKMADDFNITNGGVGQVCYKAINKGTSTQCENCPNKRLLENPGQVYAWEGYNPVSGRYYTNLDCLIRWTDDRLVHLQHSIDITRLKHTEEALKKQLEQQELMSAVSQSFIATAEAPALIDNALAKTGEFMGTSRVLLIRVDHTAKRCVREHEWYHPSQQRNLLCDCNVRFEPGTALHSAFLVQNLPFYAKDDLEGASDLREFIAPNSKAFLAAPVFVSGELWGLLYFDEIMMPRKWSNSDIQLIRLLASVISGVLARSQMETRMMMMSSIVESSPQLIVYVKPDGEIIYFNQGLLDMTGYSAGEIAGMNMNMLVGLEENEQLLETVIPNVLKEKTYVFEHPIRCKNGEERIVSFSIFRTGDSIDGMGAIAKDITAQKRLEQDLIAAKEQAEESSRAKGNFLSRMSHEMRTPMNAIIGMTNIAQASPDPEKQKYCLEKIDDASRHLLGVINDILDMSKIEANKFELTFEEFNLERRLMRVINVMNFRLDEKKQTLKVKLEHNVPQFIVSDEQRLAQVITNLLSNANKFTPEGGEVQMHIRLLEEMQDACALEVTVQDTGIGISPEQQQRLFRSFEQADGGIARKFGGTGLGLAISKSIVEQMGGSIWVESALDEGAAFRFTFHAKRGKKKLKNLLSPDISWENLRIMAVDDSPEVLEFFQNVAATLGFGCGVAHNGESACNLLEAHDEGTFNIIFVDWRMPDINGVELTRKIKQRYGSKTVVIMISASEWSEIEGEARAAGVDHFLPKPLFASLIVNCITECLSTGKASQPAGTKTDYTDRFVGKHILLAEDVEINREIVVAMLESTGVCIDHAENGAEALRMVEERHDDYDMVFMDIHMPEMDGYEAARRIRVLPSDQARRLPIVAMTANVFREDIEKCMEAGMDGHVGKPVDYETMVGWMLEYLLGE